MQYNQVLIPKLVIMMIIIIVYHGTPLIRPPYRDSFISLSKEVSSFLILGVVLYTKGDVSRRVSIYM